MKRGGLVVATVLAVLLLPGRADAHLVNTGFGPFYDGISHLFVTAQDLLAIVALALLAGLRGRVAGRSMIFAATAAWLAGGVVGLLLAPQAPWVAASTPGFLLLGLLLALDRKLSARTVIGLAVALSVVNGFLNGAEAAASGIGLVGLAGSVASLFVVLTLVTAAAVLIAPTPARVVARVAGSWIAAIGLLMVGWMLRS